MKFSVSIPFEKGEEKKFLKYVSRQQGKGECQYLKDKKEESNNPIKLRIAEVAAIEGKYNLGVYARQYIKKGDVIGYSRKRNKLICKTVTCSKSFSQRFTHFLGPLLYNKVNRILDIYPLTKYKLKKRVCNWLQPLSYEETECLLHSQL